MLNLNQIVMQAKKLDNLQKTNSPPLFALKSFANIVAPNFSAIKEEKSAEKVVCSAIVIKRRK